MDTLKKYNLQPDYRFIQTIEPTMENASESVKTMLSLDNPPTALFCTNDTLAIGAVKTALRSGRRVPEDLAVVGHDDSNICQCIEPELTTVHVDKEKMGKIAVETLIQLINGEIPKQTVTTTETKIIVRGTT
jgi:DNA-binding LacI/PurR family transcriptional regulator